MSKSGFTGLTNHIQTTFLFILSITIFIAFDFNSEGLLSAFLQILSLFTLFSDFLSLLKLFFQKVEPFRAVIFEKVKKRCARVRGVNSGFARDKAPRF